MNSAFKTIILGAGQGRRLLPLTESKPKALIDVGGRELLAWQLAALVACGVEDVVFVAGFGNRHVREAIARLRSGFPTCRLRVLFNPFFRITDNLVSCWLARGEMEGDFLLLNGDTLFEPHLCETLLSSPCAPATVAIDKKARYDDDDMKVCMCETRLVGIGKNLPESAVQGEAVGLTYFRGSGGRSFASALEQGVQDESALHMWYPSLIHKLAHRIDVQTCLISGHEWCEVDYPADLRQAEAMVSGWLGTTAEPSLALQ